MKYTYEQLKRWVLKTGQAGSLTFVIKELTEGLPVVEIEGKDVAATFSPLEGVIRGRGSRAHRVELIAACVAFLDSLQREEEDSERERLKMPKRPNKDFVYIKKHEEIYEKHLEGFKKVFPIGTLVYANGRLFTITDWGYDVDRPFIMAKDRRGVSARLYNFEAVEVEECKKCGGSGQSVDHNGAWLTGRRCQKCEGSGEVTLCPDQLHKNMRIRCVNSFWVGKVNIKNEMKGYAQFDGFTLLNGEPVYRVKFDGDMRPIRITLESITGNFQIIR